MSLTSKLIVSAVAELTKSLDLAAGSVPLNFTKALTWSSGTGANQADLLWHDQRTLGASGTENLDLAGGLTDAFGNALTFARVKALIVAAAAGNTNNVVLGNSGVNAWLGPLGAAAHTVAVAAGGIAAFFAPAAAGWPVTAGTGDILTVTNSGAGTGVTYDIVIIGASA